MKKIKLYRKGMIFLNLLFGPYLGFYIMYQNFKILGNDIQKKRIIMMSIIFTIFIIILVILSLFFPLIDPSLRFFPITLSILIIVDLLRSYKNHILPFCEKDKEKIQYCGFGKNLLAILVSLGILLLIWRFCIVVMFGLDYFQLVDINNII